VELDHIGAAAELERCLQARPNDAAARQLLPLSRQARPDR
jgi:hypothetical protein